MLYLILYLKTLPCYREYSWKRFASKLWKSYSWLHLKIPPETYWWVTSKIIRCYRGPTLNNAFGFYRFTSRCNSLALIYVTKDFEWSHSVWLWKIRQFLLHSCMGPSGLRNHTQSQLFRRNPGMRNITQKLLTRYIFRSCISAACKKVLLRNLVYPNHKRYKTILTGTFKLGRFLLLKGRTPCCSNFIEV